MSDQMARDVRFLKRYAIVTTALCLSATLAAFRHASPAHEKFTEIDVERINVLEPDGKYRLGISNRPRSIGPIYKGKPFGYAGGGRPVSSFSTTKGPRTAGPPLPGSPGCLWAEHTPRQGAWRHLNKD